MIVEKQMDYRLTVETEVFRENLPQCHFCPSQNPPSPDPVLNPGRRGGKPATNRLSYGAAYIFVHYWGGFSPSTSVSPANLYSTNFSTITITYHLGLVQ
jgi:hypothetical protein